jgi:hypothetical protein
VAWVFADNTDNAFAADHAAKFAEGFNGGTDAHTRIIKKVSLGELKTPLWRRGGVMSNTVENSRKLDFCSFTQVFEVF